MNPKLLLCLALVLSGYAVAAQDSAKSEQWPGFPILPPITNADPTIVHPISIRVPTKLKIGRAADVLSVEIDTNSFEYTNLGIGTNMVTGVENIIYVYREGESRPAIGGYGLGGIDFNLGTSIWHIKADRVPINPMSTQKYVVEMDLIVFETDIPSQHMWRPQESEKYKMLWQRTLKQTVK
jgi:hypothetical protein